jgi:hypothetical protein
MAPRLVQRLVSTSNPLRSISQCEIGAYLPCVSNPLTYDVELMEVRCDDWRNAAGRAV